MITADNKRIGMVKESNLSYYLYSRQFVLIKKGEVKNYSCFVSLIDKYGMRWELMTEQIER